MSEDQRSGEVGSIDLPLPKGVSEEDASRFLELALSVFVGGSVAIRSAKDFPYLVVTGSRPECSEVIDLEPHEFSLSDAEIRRLLRERDTGQWRVEPPPGRFDLSTPPKDI